MYPDAEVFVVSIGMAAGLAKNIKRANMLTCNVITDVRQITDY